jgi:UDP-N-acetylmuramoyl-L-alanyl-D-glutamate--2,6-diaminopimelate ligase
VAFAPDAIAAGAAAVVASELPSAPAGVPWFVVDDARLALALLAAEFFGHPSRQMRVVGITGTNGKTTTSYLVSAILDAAGIQTGLMGTVTYRIGARRARCDAQRRRKRQSAGHDARDGIGGLRRVRDGGVVTCAGVGRADGIRFAAGVFTNLTRDHLDFHAGMDDYFAAKRRLFELLPDEAPAAINIDDPRGASLVEICEGP